MHGQMRGWLEEEEERMRQKRQEKRGEDEAGCEKEWWHCSSTKMCDFQILLLQKSLEEFPFIGFD